MSLDLHCNGKSSFHSLLMPPWIRRCQNIFNLPDFNNDWLGTAHSVHSVKPVLSPVQPVKPVQPVHSVQPLQPVQSVHSVQQIHPHKPVKADTPGALRTAGASYYITGSNSCRWRRILCNDCTSYIKAHTHLLWWQIKGTQKHNILKKRVQKVALLYKTMKLSLIVMWNSK